MPNNNLDSLNGYLVTLRLPCPLCEGKGEIVHPLRQAYRDLVKDQSEGRPKRPTFGVFALRAGVPEPDTLGQTIKCPKCEGEQWASVVDIPINGITRTDEYAALAHELDVQVGALGKTLEEQGNRFNNIEYNLRELAHDHPTPGHSNLVASNPGALEHRKVMDAEHHDLVRRVGELEDFRQEHNAHSAQMHPVFVDRVRGLDERTGHHHQTILDLCAWRHSLTAKKATRKPAPRRKAKPSHA
jgi:hypothetical protein